MGKAGQKVARVLDEYDMSGEELAALWSHEDDEQRKSVRELADYINTEITRVTIEHEAGGMTPSEYPPDRIAFLLAAKSSNASRFEDAPQGEISEVTRWLKSEGVDVAELTADFVTFGVVYDYLKNFQEAEASDPHQKTTTPAERKAAVESRFRGLEAQFKTVAEESLRSLENAGVLDELNREITVDITITCVNCGQEYPAPAFVENEGCLTCETGPE